MKPHVKKCSMFYKLSTTFSSILSFARLDVLQIRVRAWLFWRTRRLLSLLTLLLSTTNHVILEALAKLNVSISVQKYFEFATRITGEPKGQDKALSTGDLFNLVRIFHV